MKLLMDLGNSRCKCAIINNGDFDLIDPISYSKTDRMSTIKSLFDGLKNLSQVVICTVLGKHINTQLEQFLVSNEIENIHFINPEIESFEIKLDRYNVKHLGSDRLAAMVGAHVKFKANTCIVDCGTAITIDALDGNGTHYGGVIFPGVQSMQNTLLQNTDIDINGESDKYEVFARSTHEAIHSGCISAAAGGIQFVINEMQTKHGMFDKVILTGGNAEKLLSMLKLNAEYEPTLVLDGLMEISKKL